MPAVYVGGAPINSAPVSFQLSPVMFALAILSAGYFEQTPQEAQVITKTGAAPDVTEADLNTFFAGSFAENLVFGYMTDFQANQGASLPAISTTYRVFPPRLGTALIGGVSFFRVTAGVPSGPNQTANRQIVRKIVFTHQVFNQTPTPIPHAWRVNAAPAIANYPVPPAGSYVDVTTALGATVDISHTLLVRGNPDLEEYLRRGYLLFAANAALAQKGGRAYNRLEAARDKGLIAFDDSSIERLADLENRNQLASLLSELNTGDSPTLDAILMG
jgi:hypothetical protein